MRDGRRNAACTLAAGGDTGRRRGNDVRRGFEEILGGEGLRRKDRLLHVGPLAQPQSRAEFPERIGKSRLRNIDGSAWDAPGALGAVVVGEGAAVA